jgi:hypothetical protein
LALGKTGSQAMLKNKSVSTADVEAGEACRGSGNDLVNHMSQPIIADSKRDSFALAA